MEEEAEGPGGHALHSKTGAMLERRCFAWRRPSCERFSRPRACRPAPAGAAASPVRGGGGRRRPLDDRGAGGRHLGGAGPGPQARGLPRPRRQGGDPGGGAGLGLGRGAAAARLPAAPAAEPPKRRLPRRPPPDPAGWWCSSSRPISIRPASAASSASGPTPASSSTRWRPTTGWRSSPTTRTSSSGRTSPATTTQVYAALDRAMLYSDEAEIAPAGPGSLAAHFDYAAARAAASPERALEAHGPRDGAVPGREDADLPRLGARPLRRRRRGHDPRLPPRRAGPRRRPRLRLRARRHQRRQPLAGGGPPERRRRHRRDLSQDLPPAGPRHPDAGEDDLRLLRAHPRPRADPRPDAGELQIELRDKRRGP